MIIFDACPEPAEGEAMIFKALPQIGQRSMSMSKTRLSSRAQLTHLSVDFWKQFLQLYGA